MPFRERQPAPVRGVMIVAAGLAVVELAVVGRAHGVIDVTGRRKECRAECRETLAETRQGVGQAGLSDLRRELVRYRW